MRTTWNGSLSFGLVSIPVGLAPATKPAARQSDVSFRLLHRECASPIRQKRWCPVHERHVESDELVRGWEVAKGLELSLVGNNLLHDQHPETGNPITRREIPRSVMLGASWKF